MGKTEVEANKVFISRREQRYRRPYDRSETKYKRRCVFVGTTNQDTYLRDEAGNRRYWPLRVGKVDLDALKRDRELLWAEAIHCDRKGMPWHMTSKVIGLAKADQLSRVSEDIWQASLERSLEGVDEVSLNDAADMLGLDRSKHVSGGPEPPISLPQGAWLRPVHEWQEPERGALRPSH